MPSKNISFDSMDLPPALEELFSMPPAMGNDTSGGMSNLPSYEVGGMVGQGGAPVPMGATPGAEAGVQPQQQLGAQQPPMDPQVLEMHINQMVKQHPEQVQQVQQAIAEAIQTGELTQQELSMVVQLATVAAQNPQMYPHIRKFAIQNGIAGEQDLPQQYDQGLVIALMLAARAAGQGGGQGAKPVASMAEGGPVPGGGEQSKPATVEVHTGEYVIPKYVVEMKGKEFFDSLVEKYRDRQ